MTIIYIYTTVVTRQINGHFTSIPKITAKAGSIANVLSTYAKIRPALSPDTSAIGRPVDTTYQSYSSHAASIAGVFYYCNIKLPDFKGSDKLGYQDATFGVARIGPTPIKLCQVSKHEISLMVKYS